MSVSSVQMAGRKALIFNEPFDYVSLHTSLGHLKYIRTMIYATVQSIRYHELDKIDGEDDHIKPQYIEMYELNMEDIESLDAQDAVVMRIISLSESVFNHGHQVDKIWNIDSRLHEYWAQLLDCIRSCGRNPGADKHNTRNRGFEDQELDLYMISQPIDEKPVRQFRTPFFAKVLEKWEPASQAANEICYEMEEALNDATKWIPTEEADRICAELITTIEKSNEQENWARTTEKWQAAGSTTPDIPRVSSESPAPNRPTALIDPPIPEHTEGRLPFLRGHGRRRGELGGLATALQQPFSYELLRLALGYINNPREVEVLRIFVKGAIVFLAIIAIGAKIYVFLECRFPFLTTQYEIGGGSYLEDIGPFRDSSKCLRLLWGLIIDEMTVLFYPLSLLPNKDTNT